LNLFSPDFSARARLDAAGGDAGTADPAGIPSASQSGHDSAFAGETGPWKIFLERWYREPVFPKRLGLFRKHLGASALVVAELSRRQGLKRIVGSSSEESTEGAEPGRSLAEAALPVMDPSGLACLCSVLLPKGAHPYPAAFVCSHPGSRPGAFLLLVTAFPDRESADRVSPTFPFLCPLVLESAKLSLEQVANHSIDRMLQQSQRLASVGRLASGVAHDFNNLLTVIQGNVALLEEQLADCEDHQVHESIHHVRSAGDHAASLAKQLLRFSRGETEEIERVDLNEIVADFMAMAGRLVEETIEMRLILASEPLEIAADRGMVGQMLMNLIVNARDAMVGGGTIEVRTARREVADEGGGSEQWVCLEVVDDGCGIPQEHLAKIFDPFFTTKAQSEGTGLGLPNTRALVEKNRGKILVESAVGKGTRFELRFPTAKPETCSASVGGEVETPVPTADRERAPSEPVAAVPIRLRKDRLGEDSIRGETVLLVEDDSSVRKLVRRLLEMNGCLVIEASSGREAMDRWPEIRDRVSLVVTDVIMPGGVSGWDLARSLHEDRPELGILLTSGYTEHSDEHLKDSKQVKFLQKPYEASKLRDTLYRLRHPAA